MLFLLSILRVLPVLIVISNHLSSCCGRHWLIVCWVISKQLTERCLGLPQHIGDSHYGDIASSGLKFMITEDATTRAITYKVHAE